MYIEFGKAKASVLSRVYFSGSDDDFNFIKPEDYIFFDDSLVLEPYCSFMGQRTICSMGSFSYSWSGLPTWLKLGRYCSIAGGLKFMGERHPYERISSSSFTYDSNFVVVSKYLEPVFTTTQNLLKLRDETKRIPHRPNRRTMGTHSTLF